MSSDTSGWVTGEYPDVVSLQAVAHEMQRAREKHPNNIYSLAEASAIIREEYEEFWDEVKKQSAERSRLNTACELVQVAAMAVRTLSDLGLWALLLAAKKDGGLPYADQT